MTLSYSRVQTWLWSPEFARYSVLVVPVREEACNSADMVSVLAMYKTLSLVPPIFRLIRTFRCVSAIPPV